MTQVPIKIEGLQIYEGFEVIDIIDDTNLYPTLVGIQQYIKYQTIINFKKRILTFEYTELWVVDPIDPLEGQRYVEQVNNKGQDGYLDHIYNITYAMDDYVNSETDGKLS